MKNAILLFIYVLFNRNIFKWANNVSIRNESFFCVLRVLDFAPITLYLNFKGCIKNKNIMIKDSLVLRSQSKKL